MRLRRRSRVAAAAATAALLALGLRGEAHKPITSPFTFNDDVFPIVRDRCAACHAPGAVGPMSLLTHADTVPWGESIKIELMSGHMPPWSIESSPLRFRNVRMLSAREMNVLLTWASGGTPIGDLDNAPAPLAREREWPLGPPDIVLTMPEEISLGPDMQERIAEVAIPIPGAAVRPLRAVDLRPGTPALVRHAVITLRTPAPVARQEGRATPERVVGVWAPGDTPLPLDEGMAFDVPPDSQLALRMTYRKTWEHERTTMTDRSQVGLYFAKAPAEDVRSVTLAPGTFTTREALRVFALYPDPSLAHARVEVVATRPNGSREQLIAFRPRSGWARRYWLAEAVVLPAGTRIEMRATTGDEVLPPGALPVAQVDPATARITLNVIAGGA